MESVAAGRVFVLFVDAGQMTRFGSHRSAARSTERCRSQSFRQRAYFGSHITHEGSISLKSFLLKVEKSISFICGSNGSA